MYLISRKLLDIQKKQSKYLNQTSKMQRCIMCFLEKLGYQKKKINDYHFQYNSLKKLVKRLERDVKSLETKLENLNKYINRKTVVDLIYEIVSLIISKKLPKNATVNP